MEDSVSFTSLAPFAAAHLGESSVSKAPSHVYSEGLPFTEPFLEDCEPPEDAFDEYPEGGLQAYLVVLGAFFGITICFGLMNTVGVIQAHLSQTILSDASPSSVGWVFSVYYFIAFSGGIYAGPIFDYLGSSIPMYLGSALQVASLFASADCRTVWQFVLAFGVVGGIGSSFLMNCCIASVSHYFHQKRATALGICSIGGSLGGIVWPLLLRSLYPKLGFTWAMRVLGFISLFLLSCGCLLVKNRIVKPTNGKSGVDLLRDSVSLSALLKDRVFSMLAISIVLCEFSLVVVNTYISSFAIQHGYTESQAFVIAIVLNAAGLPGRYVPNYIADRYGSINVMCVCTTMCYISILVIWLPFGQDLKCLYAFAALYGFFVSSTLSLTPVCAGMIGKTEDFGRQYGTIYFLVGFVNLVSLPIGGAIIGDGSGYSNLIIFCGVLEVAAMVFWVATRFLLVGWRVEKI